MAEPERFKSQIYLDQGTRADRRSAHPDILKFEKLLHKALLAKDVPLYTHCVWRTEDQQSELVEDGFSQTMDSPHRYGCAVDIVHSVHAWDLTKPQWDIIGHIGKEVAKRNHIQIEWGGDWSGFWDPAHWQLKKWRGKRIYR